MICGLKKTLFTLAISSLGLTIMPQAELAMAESSVSQLPVVPPDSFPCRDLSSQAKVQCLVERLQSPDNVIRRFAAWDLGELGDVATEAVPYLSSILKNDKEKWERIHACLALEKIGLPIAQVLPSLRFALKDPDRDVRSCAATALGMVAVKIQNKSEVGSLLQTDLDTAISELEKSLQVLQTPNAGFNQAPTERVTTSINILKARAN